jgi:hypothetical protein
LFSNCSRRPIELAFRLASEIVICARSGTFTSRPWIARRIARNADTSATTTIAIAPNTTLKKRRTIPHPGTRTRTFIGDYP